MGPALQGYILALRRAGPACPAEIITHPAAEHMGSALQTVTSRRDTGDAVPYKPRSIALFCSKNTPPADAGGVICCIRNYLPMFI